MNRRRFIQSLGVVSAPLYLRTMGARLIDEAEAGPNAHPILLSHVDAEGTGAYLFGEHLHRMHAANPDLVAGGLPGTLAPFATMREHVQISDFYHHPHGQHLHGNGKAFFTVMPAIWTKPLSEDDPNGQQKANGVSFDRTVARTLSQGTPFESVHLHLVGSSPSSNGVDAPVPAESDPIKIYAKYFASAADAGAAKARLEHRLSALDFVVDDVKRLAARVGAQERPKLEQYLGSIEAMEKSLRALGASACVPSITEPKGELVQKAFNPFKPAVGIALAEVAGAILACGLTRTMTIGFDAWMSMEAIGLDDRSSHTLSHNFRNDMLTTWDAWKAQRLATIVERLGGRAALDSLLIMWINGFGGAHHNGFNDHVGVLIGNPGGRLASGRYISRNKKYGERGNKRCLGDFFATVAQALGLPMKTFGDPAHAKGPIDELLAT